MPTPRTASGLGRMISDFTAMGPTTTVSSPLAVRCWIVYFVVWKYPLKGRSSTSIRLSHFTEATPYQPGTNSRSGKPWLGSSVSPFMR